MAEITITGTAQVQARLRDLGRMFPVVAGNAMRAEAEIEMTEAKERTPVLTGALKASGHVVGPEITSRDITVVLRFGGPAIPYAIVVHENLSAYHRVGQAKYLESVIRESATFLPARIATRISSDLGIR